MFNSRRRTTSRQKYIIGTVTLVAIYLFFLALPYYPYEHREVIKNTPPVAVWEFIADFRRMKQLNPTILEFRILSDHGNNNDWKYSVEYLEKLSHWPYWNNTIIGDFHVRKIKTEQNVVYLVESQHKVCFFRFFCLESTGEFKIKKINDRDTQIIETVNYQCPRFAKQFCRREVEYQRQKIMHNLTYHFEQINKPF